MVLSSNQTGGDLFPPVFCVIIFLPDNKEDKSMTKPDSKAFRKHICLTAAGVTLQMLGSACLLAATLVVVKEINTQIKQILVQELAK